MDFTVFLNEPVPGLQVRRSPQGLVSPLYSSLLPPCSCSPFPALLQLVSFSALLALLCCSSYCNSNCCAVLLCSFTLTPPARLLRAYVKPKPPILYVCYTTRPQGHTTENRVLSAPFGKNTYEHWKTNSVFSCFPFHHYRRKTTFL